MSDYFPSIETFAKGAFATAATLSTVSAGLIYYGQNYLIYPSAYMSVGPGSTDVDSPDDYNLVWEDLELRTPDGVRLKCFLFPQRKDLPKQTRFMSVPITKLSYTEQETEEDFMSRRPTVIMFHGNAGTVGHRIPLGMMFQLFMRCNVLMVSYRGYGHSEGAPSEKGLKIDAQAALDYVTSHPQLSKTPIILFGQSIGGAVAIDLNSRNASEIAALIVENTFTSLPALVPHVLPLLSSVSFLCHQKWDSASKISKIPATTPILMLSGLQDEIVPPSHMKELRDLMKGQGEEVEGTGVRQGELRLTFEEFPEGNHNGTSMQRGYWSKVDEFLLHVCGLPGVAEKLRR